MLEIQWLIKHNIKNDLPTIQMMSLSVVFMVLAALKLMVSIWKLFKFKSEKAKPC